MIGRPQPTVAPNPDRLRQAAAATHWDSALADQMDQAAADLAADLVLWRIQHAENNVARIATAKYGDVLDQAGRILAGHKGVYAA